MKRYIKLILVTLIVIFGVVFVAGSFIYSGPDYKKNSYVQAYEHVELNSAPGIEFYLESVFKEDVYAKYKVVPRNKDNDEAWVYLKKDVDGNWDVIDFGTTFPHLYDKYPELISR